MELYVLDREEAEMFQPEQPTYAIRIFSSYEPLIVRGHLRYSELYKKITEYVFDDTSGEDRPDRIHISSEMANEMVCDFARHKDGVEILMVHCTQGRNRSPAVAIALNEIFKLGFNTDELKELFKEYNRYVYNKVLEAGRKINPQ